MGNFYVQVDLPQETAFTLQSVGNDDAKDSDIAPSTTGLSAVVTTTDGVATDNLYVGLVGTTSPFGTAFSVGMAGSDGISRLALVCLPPWPPSVVMPVASAQAEVRSDASRRRRHCSCWYYKLPLTLKAIQSIASSKLTPRVTRTKSIKSPSRPQVEHLKRLMSV